MTSIARRLRAAASTGAALCLSTALVVPLLPAYAEGTAAEQAARRGAAVDRSESRPTAGEALQAVRETLVAGGTGEGRSVGGHDLTLLLREVRLGSATLSAPERRTARRFLARPDSGASAFPGVVRYEAGAAPTDDCTLRPALTYGSSVCVHYATATADAPPLTDTAPRNGLPDQVDRTREVLNHVWGVVVDRGGYRAPLADDDSADPGPDGRLDVYLADLGADRLYGYCTSDDPDPHYAVSAYCVLDDDFAAGQFPSHTPMENLQVTAAHEFFHAVQFGYDIGEDAWLLEGTAAWVEDEIYDAVDDNRQYLAESQLRHPRVPLDYYSYASDGSYGPYGSWIFWRRLTEELPAEGGTGLPLLVRRVWERAAGAQPSEAGRYSTQALVRTLRADYDTTLVAQLTGFAVANRRPSRSYEEGTAYAASPLGARRTFHRAASRRLTGAVPHLATDTVRFVPGRELRQRAWRLRIRLDLPRPSLGYAAAVTVVHRDGAVDVRRLRLDEAGVRTVTVGFSRRDVDAVELTLVNASVRYRCDRSTVYACNGRPRDDERPHAVVARTFRG